MSRDFLYQGGLHPLGTSLFQDSYSSLIQLAEEFGLAEKIRFKAQGIWKTNCANDTKSKLSDMDAIEEVWRSTRDNVTTFQQVILKSCNSLACRQLIDISGCTRRCLAHTKATSCNDQVSKCSTGPGELSKTSLPGKTSSLSLPSSDKSLKFLATVVWIRCEKFNNQNLQNNFRRQLCMA